MDEMREFMTLTDGLIGADESVEIIADTATVFASTILEDLRDAVFKMRAFTESRDGDIGFGVELGMQRAADMVENIINRHQTSRGV